jgi:hypothetical protein
VNLRVGLLVEEANTKPSSHAGDSDAESYWQWCRRGDLVTVDVLYATLQAHIIVNVAFH